MNARAPSGMPFFMEKVGKRIAQLRKRRGETQQQFADMLGVTRGAVGNWELGKGIKRENLILIAERTGVTVDWLAQGANGDAVPSKAATLRGMVGAGSDMILYAEGNETGEMVSAPANATPTTVAVRIRGDSMGKLLAGWYAYYDEARQLHPRDLIGRQCVVGLKDGRVMLKLLEKGQKPKRFDLWSQTQAPIYDAEILWAAEVIALLPP